MDDFKKVIDNSLLKKVAIVGGTMGIREIVEFVDLKCPCLEEYNVVYAWCSMLIPALVFFLVGLLPMRRMCGYSSFRYFASICGRTEGETTEHPFSSLSFSCEKGKRTECCYNLCSHLDTALVAPITWIIAVHLQGDLFICANATQNYTSLPCKDPEKEILNENQKNFLSESKARSQMIGWIFMAGAIAFLVLSVFCNRCVDANIVINKKYMDAAYDALNDEFYKCKKKKAISDLKKKLKKKRVRDRPAKHPGDRFAKTHGDYSAIHFEDCPDIISVRNAAGARRDLFPASHSFGVRDRPAKHPGDYAAIPLMERCRSMTSVRNDIPEAKVCSPASHSSGDIPAAKVCSPASHSSGDIPAAEVCSLASHSSGVEAETSDLPAHTTSFLMKKELQSIEAETNDLPTHRTSLQMKHISKSSGGARRDLFPASHSFGVEAATSDLPAYPPSFGAMGARRDLFPASHSFGVERATSDLPAHPPSSGDEDSEDTDEEWNNIVNLYKRA